MTAPVSLDKKKPPPVQGKPIPYKFLRYPGSWFYLIVTWAIGLLWVPGLIEATKMGAFAVDHFQDVSLFSFGVFTSAMFILLLGLYSLVPMIAQLKASKIYYCEKQLGPAAYNGFRILSWFNFFGWFLTGLLGLVTLPDILFLQFLRKMYCFYGIAPQISYLWSYGHIHLWAFLIDWRRRPSVIDNQQPA